ncbi:MAG: metallophosphoesterase family protein [Candidatus Omnitrophota bacterium]
MRYGIIGDIHGNLEAFETALEALSHERIDKYLCVGDIVGYGTDPRECIKMTRDLGAVTVCGNHDAACIGRADINYFNNPAQAAIMWTKQTLSENDLAFLKGLDLTYRNEHLTLVHGTLAEPEEFHYMFDGVAARGTLNLMETDICFVGHSHMPGIFLLRNGGLKYFYKEKTKMSRDEKLIVNTGSIGQPRDGDPRLCYCVYDTDTGFVELKRIQYDIEKAQKKTLKAGLPAFLAYRLGVGV